MTTRISVTGATRAEVAALLDSAVASGRHAAHRGPKLIPGTTRWRLDLWLDGTEPVLSDPDNAESTPVPDPVSLDHRRPVGPLLRIAVGGLLLATTAVGYWLAAVPGAVAAAVLFAVLAGLISIASELQHENTANLKRS